VTELACGRSDRPRDPSLSTAERFAAEVAVIVGALGRQRLHVWGHSWGTTLAVLYALTRARDDSARLDEITVPALLTCGRADLATPATNARYRRRLADSRLVVFDRSSHWYLEEEPDPCLEMRRRFPRPHDDLRR
jgi:pimeloyl-ACP methyl ester carboxylesterase